MITVAQAAKKLKLSEERVRRLLRDGRIMGAQKVGALWAIPGKPVIRMSRAARFRELKQEAKRARSFTPAEAKRWQAALDESIAEDLAVFNKLIAKMGLMQRRS